MADLNLDLFAGGGGWSEGLRLLGLRDVGLEWDAAACATRAAAGHTTIRCDVAQYPVEPLVGRATGLIASPPCQAWSRAGKGLGLKDQPLVHQAVHDLAHGRDTRSELLASCRDGRSLLAAEPVRWARDLRPEWIALEEVPDVLPLFQQIAEILRGWGYSVWAGILNAADYGVPQTRRRAILVASRVRKVTAPAPTHTQHPAGEGLFGESLPGWVSMAEALGRGAGLRVNTRGARRTSGGNEFSADRPAWCLTEKARSWVLRNGNQPNAAVRAGDEPAPTIAFGNNSARIEWVRRRPATTVYSTGRTAQPGHRDRSPNGESQFAGPDTVRITVEEAAVLQSFRADYPWQGSKSKTFLQVGNAVPPLLAAHIVAAATGANVPAFTVGSAVANLPTTALGGDCG